MAPWHLRSAAQYFGRHTGPSQHEGLAALQLQEKDQDISGDEPQGRDGQLHRSARRVSQGDHSGHCSADLLLAVSASGGQSAPCAARARGGRARQPDPGVDRLVMAASRAHRRRLRLGELKLLAKLGGTRLQRDLGIALSFCGTLLHSL